MNGEVRFKDLTIGEFYSRPQLSLIWGYRSHQAFGRGVFTPSRSNYIVLFVTKEKQSSLTQYQDYICDNLLYWDGEEKGLNNKRIIASKTTGDEIHLFYRQRHHQDFKYLGIIEFLELLENDVLPYKFLFQILGDVKDKNDVFSYIISEIEFSYMEKPTENIKMTLNRIGQGKFRVDLLNLWGSCSVTEINIPEILKASHIKPWRNSNNIERLDPFNGLILTPNLDSLFDRGFISFNNSGQILLSKRLGNYSEALNVSSEMRLKKKFNGNAKYLEYHRDMVFLT